LEILSVTVPEEVPSQPLQAFYGKGMWLRFSPDVRDDDAYTELDATRILDRAERAGLRFIEVRMAYGEFWQVTPAVKKRLDILIDEANKRGIAIIAWVVPRASTFQDLSLAVLAANYRTANGTGVAGLAVDLERGPEYMGEGQEAFRAISRYVRYLRWALGRKYLIIGVVEDPYLTRLTNREFPFSIVANNSNALQPMTYWRMFQTGLGTASTEAVIRHSVSVLTREARRPIPINVGGQTSGLGSCGPPPANEIQSSLTQSRRSGAIGETFFDWNGTLPEQWDAIGAFRW
jgi:hypothetical protein